MTAHVAHRTIRHAVIAGGAPALLALALAVMTPLPEAHALCQWVGSKGSTWTGLNPNGCTDSSRGQARIYRYIAAFPTAFDSAIMANSYAYVTSSSGTNAGHAARAGTTAGMDGWYNF